MATVVCPVCAAELEVTVSTWVSGSGMGPLGQFKIGVMSSVTDKTAVDEHALTHNADGE